jgi:hypothetical protein
LILSQRLKEIKRKKGGEKMSTRARVEVIDSELKGLVSFYIGSDGYEDGLGSSLIDFAIRYNLEAAKNWERPIIVDKLLTDEKFNSEHHLELVPFDDQEYLYKFDCNKRIVSMVYNKKTKILYPNT